ncbi:MAG TPA: hypothetical protein VKU00_05145 [Chthonomonadaceae bacterium]|nr:hypothetical protein [Chthonomonadaceae bacterium]
MGYWHFEDLRNALAAKGWQILSEQLCEGMVAGSWEIQRSARKPPLFIDFTGGWDGPFYLTPRTLPQSYGCHLRGYPGTGLYFSKQHKWGDRRKWKEELRQFINLLDKIDNNAEEMAPGE